MRSSMGSLTRLQLRTVCKSLLVCVGVGFLLSALLGLGNAMGAYAQLSTYSDIASRSSVIANSAVCNPYKPDFSFSKCQPILDQTVPAFDENACVNVIYTPLLGAAHKIDSFSFGRSFISGAHLAGTALGMVFLLVVLASVIIGSRKNNPPALMVIYRGYKTFFGVNVLAALVTMLCLWLGCSLGWFVGSNLYLATQTPIYLTLGSGIPLFMPLVFSVLGMLIMAALLAAILHIFTEQIRAFYYIPAGVGVCLALSFIPQLRMFNPAFWFGTLLGLPESSAIRDTRDFLWVPIPHYVDSYAVDLTSHTKIMALYDMRIMNQWCSLGALLGFLSIVLLICYRIGRKKLV